MLELMTEIASYICQHTYTSYSGIKSCTYILAELVLTECKGDIFSSEYHDRIDRFKTELLREKEYYDRTIQGEIFRAVVTSGA